jgi:hypothetical protein
MLGLLFVLLVGVLGVPQDLSITTFTVTNSGRNYLFNQGNGLITDSVGSTLNPPLNLTLNETYTFICATSSSHRFAIHNSPANRSVDDRFDSAFITGQGKDKEDV